VGQAEPYVFFCLVVARSGAITSRPGSGQTEIATSNRGEPPASAIAAAQSGRPAYMG